MNGGFYWKRKSNGERQLQNLGKWVQENQDNWNEKCLLILDEADKGKVSSGITQYAY